MFLLRSSSCTVRGIRIVSYCKRQCTTSTNSTNTIQTNVAKSKPKKSKKRKESSTKSGKSTSKKKALSNDGGGSISMATTSRTLSTKILGNRVRCDKLKSFQEEFFVVSLINVLLGQGMVQHAEPLLNEYRREGHQFDTDVYNNIIIGWAEKGNDVKARLLYQSMLTQGVPSNYRTFGALLYLYARTDDYNEASKVLELLKDKGLNESHILYYSSFNTSQATIVSQLLKQFNIPQTAPTLDKPSCPPLAQPLYKPSSVPIPACSPTSDTVDVQSLLGMVDKQLEIEEKSYEVIPSISDSKHEPSSNISGSMLSALRNKWEDALCTAIDSELNDYNNCLRTMEEEWYSFRSIPKHYPFLATLSAKEWAQIAMEEIVNRTLYNTDGQTLSYICHCVLGPSWRKFIIGQEKDKGIVDKVRNFYRDYVHFVLEGSFTSTDNGRQYWEKMKQRDFMNGSMVYDNRSWPYTVGVYLGSALVDVVLQVLKVPKTLKTIEDINDESAEMIPAFIHTYDSRKVNKKVGVLKAQPSLYRLMKTLITKDRSPSFKMPALELPMVVPPRPWTSVTEGGYLISPGSVVRCYEDTYQHQLLLQAASTMDPVLDSLNYLSCCPWRVNNRILDLIIDLFNKGGDEALDVPITDLPEIPPLPPKEDDEDDDENGDNGHHRRSIIHQRKAVKKLHKETYALRMDMLYKLSIANHYRDKIFWFPHNMDFRSRVYPIPPHVSHISSDLGRSLIKFGVGYPLGEYGLDWMKIHLATLHGEKSKNSFKDRLQFTEQNLDNIFDSADYPFTGKKWWQSADEPWQTLACCMELADAMRSPNPSEFISSIPVHQDGSCNGLQHYAAMGRDQYGAEQVNLVPFDKPADLYSGVAGLVDKLRKRDAEEGNELAKVLEGKVHRKVVKQTVMTVVYGVTWVGGRLQIERQLKGTVPDKYLFKASSYLVTLVFSSLSEMFSNARKIQDWLTTSARMIALSGHPVEWVTPLGMPVVQPYHKPISKSLLTKIQHINKQNKTDFSRPPDSVKQKNAMPPNFVHSLDSTHMMLTSLYCQRAKIPFVAVHDSYWTHPCFVNNMNEICREQFIALHNEPILEDLAEFFETKYGGLQYNDSGSKLTVGKPGVKTCSFKDTLPSKGEFKLECVKDSTYFFS